MPSRVSDGGRLLAYTEQGGRRFIRAPSWDAMGQLDILVCNAGVVHVSPVERMSEEEWDLTFDVILRLSNLLSGRRYRVLDELWSGPRPELQFGGSQQQLLEQRQYSWVR